MRFYSYHQWDSMVGPSCGIIWFTNRADAERARREWVADSDGTGDRESNLVQAVDITPTKRGILRALRAYASHPDNG